MEHTIGSSEESVRLMPVIRDGLVLPVMEAFYTIQGEGKFSGEAAFFIRLAGCDVGCHWCDVKESWDAEAHEQISVDELVSKAHEVPSAMVVITGGEPAMYDLHPLTQLLQGINKSIHIETSGAYALSAALDWVTVSPKKFKQPLDSVLARADELKVVVYHPSDLAWAETFRDRIGAACELYLQPEWSREKNVLPLIIDYVKEHPEWKISLQSHKYMHIP